MRHASGDRPWDQENERGEKPGSICCLRSMAERCYEHTEGNWRRDGDGWVNFPPDGLGSSFSEDLFEAVSLHA